MSFQSRKGDHICGGTWFRFGNRTQILTAAHCVVNDGQLVSKTRVCLLGFCNQLPIFDFSIIQLSLPKYQIMGDDISVSKYSPNFSRQIRKIRKIVPHPRYSRSTMENDIAVIFVRTREIFCHSFIKSTLNHCNQFIDFSWTHRSKRQARLDQLN